MSCKYCGKDVGKLEKCPFCSSREAVKNTDSENKGEGNTPHKQTGKKKNKARGKGDKTNSQSFFEKLCKENKFFNFLNTFNKFVGLIMISLFLLSVLLVLCFNKEIDLGVALIVGIINAYPLIVCSAVATTVISFVIMIIFITQMKKKNPSNKLLFNGISRNGKLDYDGEQLSDINNVTWQGIAYKYDRASLAISIIQMIIKVLDTVIMLPAFLALRNLKHYASVGALLRGVFSAETMIKITVFVLIGIILLSLTDFIIGQVRKSRQKKLAKKFQANELK